MCRKLVCFILYFSTNKSPSYTYFQKIIGVSVISVKNLKLIELRGRISIVKGFLICLKNKKWSKEVISIQAYGVFALCLQAEGKELLEGEKK